MITVSSAPSIADYAGIQSTLLFICWRADSASLCFSPFVFVFRYLYRADYSDPPWLGDVLGLAVLVALAIGFTHGSKIYVPSALLLTTLALALMARQRFAPYLFVFLLCCINKETAVLLPILFAVYYFLPATPYRSLVSDSSWAISTKSAATLSCFPFSPCSSAIPSPATWG